MRLDRRLVAAGLAESRARAQALIRAGMVTVDGAVAIRAASSPPEGARIALRGDPCPWVSRAALKLLHALALLGIAPEGPPAGTPDVHRASAQRLTGIALDLGASTGGFTEVLLACGAARVYAVDVG
ncbi:MAG TPA: SAM-dependent methyltransferase, partial [Paracoccaceae bacterium]|nr:SAM-dependent methyltransferase [Paracoccaceae bacterium]